MKRVPTPLGDRIIVERAPAKKYEGRIALPDLKHSDKTDTGVVLSVGRDVVDVGVLDTVMFSRLCNDEIEVDGVKYLTLREQQVLGVLV